MSQTQSKYPGVDPFPFGSLLGGPRELGCGVRRAVSENLRIA
jgi:hypothetical protein